MAKITNEMRYKTAEERVRAYKAYEDAYDCETTVGGFTNWLALEAKAEKPENCPFCGGEMYGRFNSFGPSIWSGQCACGYKTKDFLTKEDTIAAHNRVARAVKDAEIAELRRRLKVAEDALKELQARCVASVHDGTIDPYEALKIAEDALAAIRGEGGAK